MLTEPIIIRRLPEYQAGIPGTIIYKKEKICHSLELPWRDNRPNISCIPLGKYEITRTWSEKFERYTYEIVVAGRTGIRIHAGNELYETEGCIMPCQYYEIGATIRGVNSAASLYAVEAIIAVHRVSRLVVDS